MLKAFCIIFVGVVLLGCQSQPSLKIATSANLQFAMKDIAAEFEKEHSSKVDLIVSSSGKLAAQIEQGAPFDVFVAANMFYPSELCEKKLTTGVPKVYAHGQLVLWTLKDMSPSIDVLSSSDTKRIALPNPKTAPYGVVAIEALKAAGVYESVKEKLIFGESVAQTNQFISTNAVDVGFTAQSTVYADELKSQGNWSLVKGIQIEQGVVLLKRAKDDKRAKAFYDFLFTEKAQEILNKYGYLEVVYE